MRIGRSKRAKFKISVTNNYKSEARSFVYDTEAEIDEVVRILKRALKGKK